LIRPRNKHLAYAGTAKSTDSGASTYLPLGAAAEALPGELVRARKEGLGHREFLCRLLDVEIAATEARRRGLERFAS
jgi:hypothetical protein